MTNTAIVCTLKNNIIHALCGDSDIDTAIDSPTFHGSQLMGTHVFHHNKNPADVSEPITFINVTVDTSIREQNESLTTSILSVYIYSHRDHLDLPTNLTDENTYISRNDHLASLISRKLNGNCSYGGFGPLKFMADVEIPTDKQCTACQNQSPFSGRKLTFQAVDRNHTLYDGM